jgi:lysine biosynthesis protein LysW
MEDFILIHCPECNGELEIPSDAMLGEVFECIHCGVELEVFETEPDIQVEVYQEEEK